MWQCYECLLTDRGEKPVYTRARACIGEERGGLCGPLPEGPPHSLTGGAAHWLYLQGVYIYVYMLLKCTTVIKCNFFQNQTKCFVHTFLNDHFNI